MPYTTLISAQQLAQHITDSAWVVLDCRHDLLDPDFGRSAFAAGHLPKAQYANVDTDLSDKSPGQNGQFRGRHPLPERDAFIETLRRWGVNRDSQVVVYDAHGGMFAARLWWMLRWVGHEAVAVLDGGLPAWHALNLPLTIEAASRPRGNFEPKAPLGGTVTVDEVSANLATQQRLVIDARSPDRFRGENETIDPVGGHIPGAKNRFFKNNLDAEGRFKSPEQLRADFGDLTREPSSAIMQCGSGVTACHNLLALEIAGMPGALLYPGSWSEWCADSTRPIAKGE